MLDQRLQLGGLQVGGPRTAQNPARFRVANNVYQTRDDYMVPRNDTEEYQTGYVGNTDSLRHLGRYRDKPFVLGFDGTNYLPYYESTSQIPNAGLPIEKGSLGVQSLEKLGNLYLNFPHFGLFKYDGYQMYRAGTPLPYSQPGTTGPGPTISPYVRLIQHHIDQQGNVINSNYAQYGQTVLNGDSGTPTYYSLTVRTDKGATDDFSTTRQTIDKASLDNNFLAHFIYATVANNLGGNVFELTTGGDHNVVVGEYLCPTFDEFALEPHPLTNAWKVLSTTATTVTVGNPRSWSAEDGWQDETDSITAMATPVSFTNYWISAWTSTSETGAYIFQGLVPAMYESNSNKTYTIPVIATLTPSTGILNYLRGFLGLAPILGDVYDVLSLKSLFPLNEEYKPLSFSTYGDLGLLAYSNEIYFSDVTLGGAFEMTTGGSFILVGEGDDGDVQSVCGTSDFALISRKFKNYYLTGNIPTANYRVAEISQTSLGCYSNETSIAVVDKIIFLNKQGVWALYGGGRCEELSFAIKGLFDNFSATYSWSEETFFNLDDLPTFANATDQYRWIRARFDVNRNLLAFMNPSSALILNLNNGEFYTWNGLVNTPNQDIHDIVFINGQMFTTHNDFGVSYSVYVEDEGRYAGYIDDYPPQLATTWFTANSPSLEKKLNQLKIFGLISSQVDISHKLDWKDTVPSVISDGTFLPVSGQYSNKHRLKPANFLAVSVSMTFTGGFQIEGLEIEFQALQEGMKR